ncbi:unnamed protein product, partial [Rotaria sp. Silwood2]
MNQIVYSMLQTNLTQISTIREAQVRAFENKTEWLSGLDSIELVHRVWRQLIFCLKNLSNEQVTIKPSFIKALIETLGNENGESNYSAIECCLLIGNHGKELDYKYEQLVDLLRIVLTKHKENEQLLNMVLNKYWTTIRVQGNINK